MNAQGQSSPNVVKVVKTAVPNNWPPVRSIDEIDQVGKVTAKWRFSAGLSNGQTVAFGSKSSTYRSKGSTGKGENDPTIRPLTIKGKSVTWQVYPSRPADEDFLPYFMVLDLYQNYVKGGASTSRVLLDAVIMTLSDPDMCHAVLTGLGGVSDDEFNAWIGLCEALRDYWQGVTAQPLPIGAQAFDFRVADGSIKAASSKPISDVTDFATFDFE